MLQNDARGHRTLRRDDLRNNRRSSENPPFTRGGSRFNRDPANRECEVVCRSWIGEFVDLKYSHETVLQNEEMCDGKGPQHLFAVLPTVEPLALPFSINAPFLLKPDRFDVKANSVTNRWLLQRAAELVAEVMVAWLSNEVLSEETRADAYRLLPGSQALYATPAAKQV